MRELSPGKYMGKAVDGAFQQKGAASMVKIGFEFEAEGEKRKLFHTAFFGEKRSEKDGKTQTERAFETLARIGFDESKPLLSLPSGEQYFDASFLADREVSLDVRVQEDKNGNVQMNNQGQPYMHIAFVNEPGGGQVAGASIKQVVGNVDVRAMMAAARARIGAKKEAPKVADEEIPY